MIRHSAAVCAAARQRFNECIGNARHYPGSGESLAMEAVRFEAAWSVRCPALDDKGCARDMARVLGAWAAATVLRVRARRAASLQP